jgi:uncharacterized protein DUF4234
MSTAPASGPLGHPRGVAFVILIGIITFGVYWIYWAYSTQEEMKRHTGQGLGGVLGLVIWILISAVSAFVIPSEIGNMYAQDGKPKPITGWTGLWLFPFGIFLIPLIVWFVKVQRRLNEYWEAKQAGATAAPPVATA